MLVLTTAWQMPEPAKVMVDAFLMALKRARIEAKEAASLQGISESQWNQQTHGRGGAHMSFGRVCWLMTQRKEVFEFWIDELKRTRCEHPEAEAIVRQLIDIAQVYLLQVQLAGAPAKRPMAKAELTTERREEKVS